MTAAVAEQYIAPVDCAWKPMPCTRSAAELRSRVSPDAPSGVMIAPAVERREYAPRVSSS